jgi:hypothetical protein
MVWIALTLGAGTARAEQTPDAALDRCESGTRDRLHFIEGHLDGARTYANRWWLAWNGVYTGGIVFEGGRAWMADDRGERADHVTSAVKSVIGLTENLLRPPPAKHGTRDLRGIATDSSDGCAQRLARAEEILRENAAESRRERWSWKPHAANLALNLAGALIVAEGFDESSGWTSGALGIAVGEGRIWSYPWQADGALEEYERRFPASGLPSTPETTWRLESWGAGARVVVRY